MKIRPMCDAAKIPHKPVLVYFKQHGWMTVQWDNRHLRYDEEITLENGIWCVNDHKNDVWHLRGYCDGDDLAFIPLDELPKLSNICKGGAHHYEGNPARCIYCEKLCKPTKKEHYP